MQVHLYGHECSTLPLNSVAIAAMHSCAEQQSWCAIRAGDAIVVLRVKIDSDVAGEDAVANLWVMDALKIRSGTLLSLELVELSTPVQDTVLELNFVAHISQKHWDEVPFNGPLIIPHIWSAIWPTGTKVSIIESHCKLVLMGTALCDGALIAVQALDSLLIFRVGIPNTAVKQDATPSLSAIVANELCNYHIIFPRALEGKPHQAHSPAPAALASDELCFVPAISTVQCICNGVFVGDSTGTRIHGLAKSMLVSAPQGGGKSHLLDAIAHLSVHTLAPANVEIIRLSCKDLVQSSKALPPEELAMGDDLNYSSASSEEARVYHNLAIVLRMLGCSPDKCERIIRSSPIGMPSLLILMDDIDCVFSRYSNSKDDNIPHASDGDTYKRLGYHLGIVLSELSKVTCSLPIVIVSATRRPSAQLLRAHTGCPEFERCLELSSPTYTERTIILRKQIALSELQLQPLEIAAIGENHGSGDTTARTSSSASTSTSATAQAWAERLAGLTAGYLPGDLHSVIQRMGFLHCGKLAAVQHQKLRDQVPRDSQDPNYTEQDQAVQWSCALEAVVAVVPRQLHGLSAQSGRQGAGGRLSWQDFAGYSELVADLKRRLLPRTVSLQGSTVTSAGTGTASSAVEEKSSAGVPILKASVLRGLVLYGPTGCGKTLLASVITSELKMNFVSVRSTDLLSKYFGETENTIRNLFRKARSAAPCVLFFDDFDSLAHKRSAGDADGSTSNGLHGRILSTFLNELDGIMTNASGSSGNNSNNSSGNAGGAGTTGNESQILVIAACQDLSNLDEALIRPGRLQHHVYLHPPREADIRAILHRYLRRLNCAPGLATEPAVTALSRAATSASEVECFVRSAFMHALREKIHSVEAASAVGGGITLEPAVTPAEARVGERGVILQKHIDQALQNLVLPQDVEKDQSNNDTANVADELSSGPTVPAFSWGGGFSVGK